MVRRSPACSPWAKAAKCFFLGVDLGGGLLGQGRIRTATLRVSPRGWPRSSGVKSKGRLRLVLQIPLVFLAVGRRDVLVVAGQRLEGRRRHALAQLLAAGKAYDGVAALDVVVEEVERLAGNVRLEP